MNSIPAQRRHRKHERELKIHTESNREEETEISKG